MTKLELIDKVSSQLGVTKKQTSLIINAFLENIKEDVMNGEKVVISNFGTFYKSEIKGYEVYNPRDGEKMYIDNIVRINFNSSSKFKDMKKNISDK